ASYHAWAQDLAARGLRTGGEKLTDDGGRQLRLKDGRPLATDGPYAEAHDVIGGIFTIKAENDAQAEELALSCPHLLGSQWIEIRRIEVLG
ncbi:MAG: transcription initiation protein, partial [Burkholderiales bacterium PBB5]